MLIRKSRWLLIVALFVMAPMVGLIFGVFGGLQLLETAHEQEVDDVVVVDEQSGDEAEAGELPEVTMTSGESVALDQVAPGQKLAVVVMKDPACPVCQNQLEVLSNRLDEVVEQGATVVGLSDAPECVNRRLMQRLELKFPVVSDVDHEVLQHFEMTAPGANHVMPGLIFVDEAGEVDFVHKGRAPGQQQERIVLDWVGSD